MRKILLSFVAIATSILTAGAWSYDMTEENSVLGSDKYNMRLYKSVDYVNNTVNGVDYLNGDADFTLGSAITDFKVNSYNPMPVLNEGMEFMYIQLSGDKGIKARPGYGLWNYGSGDRWFLYSGLKAGQIIAIQWGLADQNRVGNTIVPNVVKNDSKTNWTDELVDPLQVEDITAEIYAIQEATDADGDGTPDGTNDGLLYWRVLNDGWVYFKMQRGTCVQGVQIWMSKDAQEIVTSPALKLVKVNEESRSLEVKVGESSLGNAVTTWYSTDGSDPIFMEETEEIASKDTIFVIDEATGEPALDEEGNKIVESITVNYVKVPVFNEEFGVWGDYEYVPGDEATIDISSADDEDGDGFVTVKIACITADGVMSEIVETNVSVGTITLNAPTLTLVGMDGTSRNYQIGWTNNTLCGEEFMISYETAEDGMFENVAIGDIVSSSEWITVTVSANGYADGVADLQELDNEGLEYARKNTENAGNSVNDWEFQNLTEEQYKMIRGQILDYAYFVTTEGDTTKFTAEEYTNGEVDIPEGTVEVYKHYGWWWDGGSNDRATLGVLMDTVWTDTTMVDANGEMVDTTVYVIENVRYEDELVGLFHSGLSIDCPPNAKNNSCIMMYCDLKPELGLYMMSKSTINIEGLQYGEYVTMSLGTGGSNYVNNTWTSCDMNTSVDGMFSKTLSAGTHVLNINVYTSENLPDAIEKVVGNKANYANVYSIDGRMVRNNANVGTALNGLEKGIYIMNGKKYLVK